MNLTPIKTSVRAYETWLRRQLRGQLVERDLAEKHSKMAELPFAFLRATYWRWAETIFTVAKDLKDAPEVLAIGDIHLENFGTWRDREGRLVWGVNDFDEAAVMPYTLDLVRLATSAMLARTDSDTSEREICRKILEGFKAGLASPHAFVLDRDHAWLRKVLEVSEEARADFWNKKMAPKGRVAPRGGVKRYVDALHAAMPEGTTNVLVWRRSGGLGSLGRPRLVALASWCDGPVVREAKALVPSGWAYVHGPRNANIHCGELAAGTFRSPDPWYSVTDDVVVRRLSPNNRKVEVEREADNLLAPRMLHAMGYEIANIHLGGKADAAAIAADLNDRSKNAWLRDAAVAAAERVREDYEAWAPSLRKANDL